MSQAVLTPSSRPRHISLASVVLALLLLFSGVFGDGLPAHAADTGDTAESGDGSTTVSWSVRPADTAQGSGRPNFAYEVAPGGTLSDAILVTNRGAAPIELDVYAADGFLTADGSLDILSRDEASTELGSWITVATPRVSVDSGATVEVPFSVQLPAEIQPGDYAAGLVAAMRVESTTGVVTERRLGSRIHLRVSGALAPALTVTDVTIEYSGTLNPFDGAATVGYTLTNTGNARLQPGSTVTVEGPFGWVPVAVPADEIPELLPGSSLELTSRVEGVLPLVWLTGEVAVDGTIVARPGAPAEQTAGVAVASASASTWAVPWSALILLLAIAAIVVLVVVMRRRSQRGRRREVDAAVAAALAEREASDRAAAPFEASAPSADAQPEQPEPAEPVR